MLQDCYLCGTLLVQPFSKEHLLPEGIGGRPTSRYLLCGPCNNGLASRIDAGLFAQIGYLYRLVVQARPNTPTDALTNSYLADGTKVEFRGLMRPRIPITIQLGEMKPVRIMADKADAKLAARKKLIQLQGALPMLDVDSALEKLVMKEAPDALHFFSNGYSATQSQVGGLDFFRAINKIALNFYLHNGGQTHYVQHVIQQVKEGFPLPSISKFYYPTVCSIHELAPQEVSHVVELVGNPEWGVLYCYIELFNVHNVLVLLNDQYAGEPINVQYCYDLLLRTPFKKEVSLPAKFREHITDYFLVESVTQPQVEVAYKRTRDILYQLMREKGLVK
ncbi:MAG: hypothetical protein EOO55_00025 [Hymenobacter sp.]|nr:MAG: hypothetical protein EOO55_00025 [Hymenobacter sp.]